MTRFCPDESQLKQFLDGRLTIELYDTVSSHIDTCTECQNRVADQKSHISMESKFHHKPVKNRYLEEAEHHRLVQQLKRLPFDAENQHKETDVSPPNLDGFQANDVIGAGGMGVVYSARETDLNRQVAIKVISKNTADERHRYRFFNEAKITGRLQHPGIVPVYRLSGDDLNPWYVMPEIRGNSFRHEIDRYHNQYQSTVDSGEESAMSLRDLLARFIDVCNAIAYAHQEGVLHRDLKPSNIMLGEFGETFVIDWGLAKHLSDDQEEHTAFDKTHNSDDRSKRLATRQGQLIGTVEFMPPEQAQGNLTELTPASDIFSLGTTLFFLLTGKTHVSGTDPEQLIEKVRGGEFIEPRSLKSSIPKPLNSICKRAMAKEPDHRYQTAKELAEDVSRFLVDLPVEAHPENVLTSSRRWLRKNPTIVMATSAISLVIFLSIAILATVIATKNNELASTVKDLDQANSDLERTNKSLLASNAAERKAKADATVQKQNAVRQASRKADILTFFEENVLSTARPVDDAGGLGRETTIRKAVDYAENKIADNFSEDALTEASIRHTLGNSYYFLGELKRAIEQLELAIKLARPKLPADSLELVSMSESLSRAMVSAGKLNEALSLQKSVLESYEKQCGPNALETLRAESHLLNVMLELGQIKTGLKRFEDLFQRASSQLKPEDPEFLGILQLYCRALMHNGRFSEALPLLSRLVDSYKKTVNPENNDLISAKSDYAATLYMLGKVEQSVPIFEDVANSQKRLRGVDHPLTLSTFNNLGRLLLQTNHPQRAAKILKEASSASKSLGDGHIIRITLLSSYSDALFATEKIDEAIAAKKEARKAAQTGLGDDHPTTLDVTGGLASLLLDSSNHDKEALDVLKQLAPKARRKFGPQHPKTLKMEHSLGLALFRMNKIDESVSLLKKVLETRLQTLPENHPFIIESLYHLPAIYESAGLHNKAEATIKDHIKVTAIHFERPSERFYFLMEGAADRMIQYKHFQSAIKYLRICLENQDAEKLDQKAHVTRGKLGYCLAKMNQFEEAEKLLLTSYESLSAFGEKDEFASKQATEIANKLEEFYRNRGDDKKAELWRKKKERSPEGR